MTTKYFSYGGSWWTVWENFDPWGNPLTYAIECDNNDCDHENSAWEYVDASTVTISDWFLRTDKNELFLGDDEYDEQYEKEHDDPNHPPNIKPFDSMKLKAMLEGLKRSDIIYENPHESEDILGLIRARNSSNTTSVRVLSEKELAALNQSDAEYELLNIDASYMALVRKLG